MLLIVQTFFSCCYAFLLLDLACMVNGAICSTICNTILYKLLLHETYTNFFSRTAIAICIYCNYTYTYSAYACILHR